MRPNIAIRCGLCMFWSGEGDKGSGRCHRHPPQNAGVIQAQKSVLEPNVVIPVIVSGFPETQAMHWCGDFVSIEQPVANMDS